MIRLVIIGDQIIRGHKDFGFYDTVLDCFSKFGDQQVFSSLNDFLQTLDDCSLTGACDRWLNMARSALESGLVLEEDPE